MNLYHLDPSPNKFFFVFFFLVELAILIQASCYYGLLLYLSHPLNNSCCVCPSVKYNCFFKFYFCFHFFHFYLSINFRPPSCFLALCTLSFFLFLPQAEQHSQREVCCVYTRLMARPMGQSVGSCDRAPAVTVHSTRDC